MSLLLNAASHESLLLPTPIVVDLSTFCSSTPLWEHAVERKCRSWLSQPNVQSMAWLLRSYAGLVRHCLTCFAVCPLPCRYKRQTQLAYAEAFVANKESYLAALIQRMKPGHHFALLQIYAVWCCVITIPFKFNAMAEADKLLQDQKCL